MRCPYCQEFESRVVDSRASDDGTSIRRRRECNACKRRFTTYERIEERPLVVVKKDGSREQFNRDKLMAGIIRACEKRPVSLKELEALVQEIEKQIFNSLEQEITSQQIGQMVMERLKKLDEVAYVRFSSVYRQFKDINTFMEELNKLLMEK